MKSLRYKTCVRYRDAPRDRFLTEISELNSRNIAMANSVVQVSLTRGQKGRVKGVTVRATAVGRDAERNALLAGDPKWIRLLCNITLITDIPSRGSKEERIRIHLQVWANIRNNGYKR